MSKNSAHDRLIRARAAATGEDYMEARTRLTMMAKVPSLPAPLAPSGDDYRGGAWDGPSLKELYQEDWDGKGVTVDSEDRAALAQKANTKRAGWALAAIRGFTRKVGTDEESVISDLLCDLMHLCDALGVDFEEQAERGARHHAEEIHGEL